MGTIENNYNTEQLVEQLVQKDKHIAELAGQLANQTQKFADREKEIYALKMQIEYKDQQLAQANREVRFILGRMMQKEEPLDQDRVARADGLSVGETVRGEIDTLRDKFERLEHLVNQVRFHARY